jgi:hypothetical protein
VGFPAKGVSEVSEHYKLDGGDDPFFTVERTYTQRDLDLAVLEARIDYYLDGLRDGAEIALRDAAMIASQHDHDAAVAICDMTVRKIVDQQLGGRKWADLQKWKADQISSSDHTAPTPPSK